MKTSPCAPSPSFEVRFTSLFTQGFGYAFPCDGHGRVDLDALSQRARNNYLYARAMVGREIDLPRVEAVADAAACVQH